MTPIGPRPGLTHTSHLLVDEGLTVPAVSDALSGFAGMPRVFATAYLVAFVENACIEAVAPMLPEGSKTVGTHVELSHSAATPVGMKVTASVELVEVEGRRLRFAVECRDERDVISRGHHERHIIDASKFEQRMAAKAAGTALRAGGKP
ncbi:thioesterase family protein [Streptomyces sp. SBT349]|uniref:thioesterase family protein n=1 Tax=Streptomyces sp. SBT349 TaxID=1580539 RepID=UPI00066DA2A3|nr:thioesterase family protein [Streptomyces sp. SBT349]